MIRMFVLGAALALGACAPSEDKAGGAQLSEALPAPTPQDVVIRINQSQDGQRIEVAVNQRFAVELVGVPTAGYAWAPAQIPAFLTRAGEAMGAATAAQGEPGFVGGNHWEVLMFAATAPGEGELLIEQRRPWESEEPANNSFRVLIVAR